MSLGFQPFAVTGSGRSVYEVAAVERRGLPDPNSRMGGYSRIRVAQMRDEGPGSRHDKLSASATEAR